MCVVRRRVVGLRVRSNHSKRVGIDSPSQLHADLHVDIDFQHGNRCNESLFESGTCDDVHTACALVFPVLEYFDHTERFEPDDIDVRASHVHNRRDSSSHFSRLDDRERSRQPRHHRRRL
jgi:hypothetical protein